MPACASKQDVLELATLQYFLLAIRTYCIVRIFQVKTISEQVRNSNVRLHTLEFRNQDAKMLGSSIHSKIPFSSRISE